MTGHRLSSAWTCWNATRIWRRSTPGSKDAAGGTGYVVLIASEAGIGKTALVRAFKVRQSGRAVVLWGVCDALRTPRPLGPLLDMAAAAGGELAGLVAAGAPRTALFGALLGVLAGPGRPTVAVVEDVHCADQATLDTLLARCMARHEANNRSNGSYNDRSKRNP